MLALRKSAAARGAEPVRLADLAIPAAALVVIDVAAAGIGSDSPAATRRSGRSGAFPIDGARGRGVGEPDEAGDLARYLTSAEASVVGGRTVGIAGSLDTT